MKLVLHFVAATLAYMLGMLLASILLMLSLGAILAFVFGFLGFVAGIFNGTGTEYIYQTASDGFMLAVLFSGVLTIWTFFRSYPAAIDDYFNRLTVKENIA